MKVEIVKEVKRSEKAMFYLVLYWLVVGLGLLVVDELTDGKIVLLSHLIENDDDEIV